MKFVRTNWFIFLLAAIIFIIFLFELLLNAYHKKHGSNMPVTNKDAVSLRN